MIELIRQKRMKDKFRREFGTTIDDFYSDDKVETNMEEKEQLKSEILGKSFKNDISENIV